MALGSIAGAAVRLAPATETMAVCEGIENGLTVQQATGIPTWAALSAAGMESLVLPPLPLAKLVYLAADNDESGCGLRAARRAAARFAREGRQAKIVAPPKPGTDWNDVLQGDGLLGTDT
jgi:putative DNA primase/helicase